LPPRDKSSESIYGTCEEIASKTADDESIVQEFPDPDRLPDNAWIGVEIDDDYVTSHAGSLDRDGKTTASTVTIDDDDFAEIGSGVTFDDDQYNEIDKTTKRQPLNWFPLFVIGFFCYAIYSVFFSKEQFRSRSQYTSVDAGFEPSTARV
jgi:hypothetical protein